MGIGVVDEIAPSYMGEARISIQLDPETSLTPRALEIVDVLVDVSATLPQGLVFPLEFTVISPSPSNYQRRYFRRLLPDVVSFRVFEGGIHTIRIAEVGHNRWFGELTFEVSGDVTG
jgi:hypothetical protein